MNPEAKIQPTNWGCRLTAVSLASLYTTASTLSSVGLLLALQASLFTEATVSQTLANIPASSPSVAQLPILNPADSLDPINLIPPLGYPTLPPLIEGSPPSQFVQYRLGIGDTINVFVERFPDLNFQGPINLEGNIVTPLLGAIPLVGLTLEEAQERIRFALNRYVIDPKVTATLGSPRPAQITVLGEVTKPGYYPINPGAQLTTALLTSGGTTPLADLRSVIVRRPLVDGSILEQRVDLFTPLQNGQSLPNLRLQDGDAVIVPKLEIATAQDYDRVLVSRSSLAQPQIIIRVLSYAGRGISSITLPSGSNFIDALTSISPDIVNANIRSVALVRFDPERGKAITQRLDGKKALLGDMSQNVPMQNNDVIVVGRTLIAKVTNAFSTFTQPFRDTLGFLLFFRELGNSASDLFGPTNSNNDDNNN